MMPMKTKTAARGAKYNEGDHSQSINEAEVRFILLQQLSHYRWHIQTMELYLSAGGAPSTFYPVVRPAH